VQSVTAFILTDGSEPEKFLGCHAPSQATAAKRVVAAVAGARRSSAAARPPAAAGETVSYAEAIAPRVRLPACSASLTLSKHRADELICGEKAAPARLGREGPETAADRLTLARALAGEAAALARGDVRVEVHLPCGPIAPPAQSDRTPT
jgi:hypothetical protein